MAEAYTDSSEKSSSMARIVNKRHFQRLEGYLNEPSVAGKIVFGGKLNEKDLYISPTIIQNAPWDSKLMTEEIFGPILPIQTVASVEEAIKMVNARPKPLALYAFTKNAATAQEIIERTSSGGVCINDCVHALSQELPFGGVGASGHGSYRGKASFDAFSHYKSIMRKPFFGDLDARFPPFTPYKEKFFQHAVEKDMLGLACHVMGLNTKG
eukprot:TRINITY_DN39083_c0_g1_i1.p1 TRINITY_DN39083_c0_g1~~TRINITY_DN39083_c0_g1_i1.p1  ORF type:complete len:239 (-),score=32.02 TRINITY_DN39083_c0_g1_i1:146-778(-)